MATLTINTSAQSSTGTTYVQNVARAARALFNALMTPHPGATAAARPAAAVRTKAAARDEMSLYRLYCLASPYDSIMPNLAQELNAMACRDDSEQ